MAKLITKHFDITYHPEHVRRILKQRLGWSSQKPRRQARERDDAVMVASASAAQLHLLVVTRQLGTTLEVQLCWAGRAWQGKVIPTPPRSTMGTLYRRTIQRPVPQSAIVEVKNGVPVARWKAGANSTPLPLSSLKMARGSSGSRRARITLGSEITTGQRSSGRRGAGTKRTPVRNSPCGKRKSNKSAPASSTRLRSRPPEQRRARLLTTLRRTKRPSSLPG